MAAVTLHNPMPMTRLHQAAPAMAGAARETLRADKAYIDLLEAESTWPSRYVLSRPNPLAPRAFPIQGLNAPHIGPAQVGVYNALLPDNYRVRVQSSHYRLDTELAGRAAFLGRGDGVMRHVNVSTALLQGNRVSERGSRTLAEREWDRRDFVAVPRALTSLDVDTRLGEVTRVGPQYLQPRD